MKILLLILFSCMLVSSNLAYGFEFPSWIKSTTSFECDGYITEHTYLHSLQYLIDAEILSNPASAKKTPAWIQNNFCWWADGKIPESELVSGLQYLASQKLISPPEIPRQGSDAKKITYGYEPLPSNINQKIVISALNDAVRNWELANTRLDFELANNNSPDILLRWQMYSNYTHDGFAEIKFINDERVYDKGTIISSFGADDCKGRFIQHDTQRMTNILMHEIGHVLGLEHHSDITHLMYGADGTQSPYDDMEYLIPERMNDYFVGQGILAEKVDSLAVQLGSMTGTLDEMDAEYKKYEGRPLSSSEYDAAKKLYNEIQVLVSEINGVVTLHNRMVDELNCFPNVRK